jgi:hypothetical protein
LCHEVTGEAAGIFDDDDADAVALDAVEKLVKAGPRLDRISTRDGWIIKPVISRDFEFRSLGVSGNRLALALLRVLVPSTFAALEVRRYATALTRPFLPVFSALLNFEWVVGSSRLCLGMRIDG